MQVILVKKTQVFSRLTAVLLAGLLASFPAFGWWETGHRTVARLAAARLTPAARTRIARILSVPDTPQAVADALAQASTWPDENRNQTSGRWHFINLALQDSKSDIPARCPHDNCVTARIRLFALELRSARPNAPQSELDALRYLIHFVGDLHQPLHAVSNADLGGNCERVSPPVYTAENLHALWDGAIVNAIGLNDRDLAADLDRRLGSFRESELAQLAAGSETAWTWESHELAIRQIYRKLAIPTQPVIFPKSCQQAPLGVSNLVLRVRSSYIDEMKPVVRQQLLKAGVRLAKILNESL